MKITNNANAAINASTGSSEAATIVDGPGNPPVAYWNFDENTGTSIKDVSGNENNSSTFNNPLWQQGKAGSGLNFSTSRSSYISVPDSNSLDAATGVTISTWIKFSSLASSNVIVSKGTELSGEINYILLTYNNEIRFFFTDSITEVVYDTTDVNLTPNRWYHITVTYTNGSSPNIYVDGILRSGTCLSDLCTETLSTNTHDLLIGSIDLAYLPLTFLNATIDELKIYNYARTQAQVAYDFNRGAPVGWWKFDECQGATAYDASGKGNSGTINIVASGDLSDIGTCNTSDTAWGDGTTGKFNSGLRLDGFNDYVDLGDPSELKIEGDLTLSVWAYPMGLPSNWMELIARGPGNLQDREYTLGATTSNTWRGCVYLSTTDYCVEDPTTIVDTQWSMVTFTRSGTTLKLYVNGKLVDTETGPATVNDVAEPVSIGRLGDDNFEYFGGIVDDVRIYNYALTQAQINTLLNEGSSLRFGP